MQSRLVSSPKQSGKTTWPEQKHLVIWIKDERTLQEDILTRFWFTYRKGFNNIGGDGPDSDQGWGCMLRCGQMLLAECLLRLHLERDFKWDALNNGNPFYWKILSSFRDDKQAPYSVQQIGMCIIGDGHSGQNDCQRIMLFKRVWAWVKASPLANGLVPIQ